MMAPPAPSATSQSTTGKEAESDYPSAIDDAAAPQRISLPDTSGDQREGDIASAPSSNDELISLPAPLPSRDVDQLAPELDHV